MMSAKSATIDLLKIKAFWYKGCDVMISAHDATKRLSSCDWNHIVNAVMWPKLGNSSITIRDLFFEGCSWINNLRFALGMALKFYTSVAKELKLKVRKFVGLIVTFVEVTWAKLVGAFPPILNRVKVKRALEARVNQFLSQNVQNNEIFEISKMLKNNRWINVYYTKRKWL